jgi:hypothetical protein
MPRGIFDTHPHCIGHISDNCLEGWTEYQGNIANSDYWLYQKKIKAKPVQFSDVAWRDQTSLFFFVNNCFIFF